MTNKDVREEAKRAGVFLWQIAEQFEMNDGNFSRKLRKELPEEEKRQIFAIIAELARGGAASA